MTKGTELVGRIGEMKLNGRREVFRLEHLRANLSGNFAASRTDHTMKRNIVSCLHRYWMICYAGSFKVEALFLIRA